MSRFSLTTIIAVVGASGCWFWLESPWRWWATGAIGAAYVVLLGLGVASIRMRFFCDAVCRGRPGFGRLALTFDDGPDAQATPRLLDLLRDQRVPAAFFCVGRRASAHPDLVRRMAAEGHAAGNHTDRHGWWTNFLIGRSLRNEVAHAQQTLCDILGRAPRYFRSPAGLTNPHLPGVLKRLDLVLVGWDVRAFDRGAPAHVTAERVMRRARDGSIILLHDGGADAGCLVGAVAQVVTGLRARGYTFVPLEDLGAGPPYGGKCK